MRTKYFLLIIVLFIIGVYFNILNNNFVSDDLPTIVNNPNISKLSSFTTFVNWTYHLNYKIGKLNPFNYHLTNIILHIINSILVFYFLKIFFGGRASFWGALIFTVHPVHTEAVTWISGRGYLLLTLFILSSLLLYVRATAKERLNAKFFIWSLVFYFWAVCASSFAYPFAAVIAAYDFISGKWRKAWRPWLAFLAVGFIKILLMLGVIGQRITTVGAEAGQKGLTNPLFNMAFSSMTHLGMYLWPVNLTLYHEPPVVSKGVLAIQIAILALVILSLPLLFKKAKALFFAVIFYLVFLMPTYSPVMISWVIAERYVYLSSAALSIFFAFYVERLGGKRKFRAAMYIFLSLLTIIYCLRAVTRNRDWRTHASIWRATAKVSPLSPRSHNNMGDVYSQEGRFDMAILEFSRAIELSPGYADAYHNRAATYQRLGRIKEALDGYKKAVYYNPNLFESHVNLGVIYFERRDFKEAKKYFQQAAQLRPDLAEVYFNIGIVSERIGDIEAAVSNYEKAIALDPAYRSACVSLNSLYLKLKPR